jgi:hypothetical protein
VKRKTSTKNNATFAFHRKKRYPENHHRKKFLCSNLAKKYISPFFIVTNLIALLTFFVVQMSPSPLLLLSVNIRILDSLFLVYLLDHLMISLFFFIFSQKVVCLKKHDLNACITIFFKNPGLA